MSDAFDPYEKWLGIPKSQQPPDHYRLLGVPPLASDAEVIANAADQRMMYLRTFKTSEQRDLAERLLTEVAAARGCLLDPVKRAAYDLKLANELRITHSPTLPTSQQPDARKVKRPVPRAGVVTPIAPVAAQPSVAAPSAPAAAPPPVAISDNSISIDIDSPRSARRTTGGKKSSRLPASLLLCFVVGGVCAAGVGLYLVFRSGDESAKGTVAAHTQTAAASSADAATEVRPTTPAAQPTTPLASENPFAVVPVAVPKLSSAEQAAALAWDLRKAVESENLARTLSLAKELAELEGKDSLGRQAELFTAYAGKATTPVTLKQIVPVASPLVRAAVAAGRADIAQPCAVHALVAYRRLDDPDSIRESTLLVLEARKTKSK